MHEASASHMVFLAKALAGIGKEVNISCVVIVIFYNIYWLLVRYLLNDKLKDKSNNSGSSQSRL